MNVSDCKSYKLYTASFRIQRELKTNPASQFEGYRNHGNKCPNSPPFQINEFYSDPLSRPPDQGVESDEKLALVLNHTALAETDQRLAQLFTQNLSGHELKTAILSALTCNEVSKAHFESSIAALEKTQDREPVVSKKRKAESIKANSVKPKKEKQSNPKVDSTTKIPEKAEQIFSRLGFKDEDFLKKKKSGFQIFLKKKKLEALCKALDKEKVSSEERIHLIANRINNLVTNYRIDYPYLPITEEEAIQDFKNLCDTTKKCSENNKLLVFEKWDFANPYKLDHICHPNRIGNAFNNIWLTNWRSATVGGKATDLYFRHLRLQVGSCDKQSPLKDWNDPTRRYQKLRRAVIFVLPSKNNEKFQELSLRTIRRSIERNTTYSCQFRAPTLSICLDLLTQKFKLDPQKKWAIFDPCFGWGNRLLGALSDPRVEKVFANDANEKLLEPAEEIVRRFNPYHTQVTLLGRPVEKLTDEELANENVFPETADAVFTSPPYYIVHKYEGKEQASQYAVKNPKRDYLDHDKSFTNWLEKFYYPMLDRCDRQLKKGGFMMINVDDVYDRYSTIKFNEVLGADDKLDPETEFPKFRNAKIYRMTPKATQREIKWKILYGLNQTLIDYLTHKKKYEFLGVLGYGMSKKNGSHGEKLAEPLWVFRKPEMSDHENKSEDSFSFKQVGEEMEID